MNFIDILKLSINNLISFKTRTILTMLGIIVGIASVVMISSLGAGTQAKLLSDVSTTFNNTINIRINPKYANNVSATEKLNDDDLEHITHLQHIKTAIFEQVINMEESETKNYARIEAVRDENYNKIYKYNVDVGRWFTKSEIHSKEEVILIDRQSAKRMYGSSANAIGKKIKFNDFEDDSYVQYYTIIGTFKSNNESANEAFKSLSGEYIEAITPYKNIQPILGYNELFTEMIAELDDIKNVESVKQSIKLALSYKNQNKPDLYEIVLLKDEIKKVTSILDKIGLFISLIASISIIVSGIGVMNIMLVSVTERITEIGLRKAIGAKNKDILKQFLIESMILTCIGGIIGIIIGYALAIFIGIFIKVLPILKINVLITSLLVSSITGLVFGIYPAKKAAKLSPIEALIKE